MRKMDAVIIAIGILLLISIAMQCPAQDKVFVVNVTEMKMTANTGQVEYVGLEEGSKIATSRTHVLVYLETEFHVISGSMNILARKYEPDAVMVLTLLNPLNGIKSYMWFYPKSSKVIWKGPELGMELYGKYEAVDLDEKEKY